MSDKVNGVPGNFARLHPLRTSEELDAMRFDELVDCGVEDFINYVGRQNLGGAMGLRNVFAVTFNQLTVARAEIVAEVKKGEISKDNPKVIETLNGLYAVMGRIEEKYPYIQARIKSIAENDPHHRGLLEK